MRLSRLSLFAAVLAVASSVSAAAPPPAVPAPVPARSAPAPAQVRLELRLTRTETEGVAGTTAPVATVSASKTSVAPAPPAIGTPILTTLDRGTATVSLTNRDLSYSVSASPSVEQVDKADSTVQVLWNLRLSGRALPEGTNSVTTTGATRIRPDADSETLLTELPIIDAKTGAISVFRLTVRVMVTKAATPGPEVGPVPPTAP